MKYTVVIPCYNSGSFLLKTVERVIEEMEKLTLNEYEIILINDGSKDNTFNSIKEISNKYNNVIGLNMSKNIGQHNAIITALKHGSGEVFINLEDDLQSDPKYIKDLLLCLENEKRDVVYASYTGKDYTFFKKLTSKFHNSVINWLMSKNGKWVASGFWVARKFVIDEIVKYKSEFTDMQSNFIRVTDNITNVEIKHNARESGSSGYTFLKSLKLWSSVLNYSEKTSILLIELGVGIVLVGWLMFLIISLIGWARINFLEYLFVAILGSILLAAGFLGIQLNRILKVVSNIPSPVVKEKTEE